MRDLTSVIDQMLAEIPANEYELIVSLASARSSAKYSSPEMMGAQWRRVAEILGTHIRGELQTWQRRVVDIWMDKPARAGAQTERTA